MNGEITKQSDIKAVSFSSKGRNSPQIKMVISLLKDSVIAGKAITHDDVMDLYCDWKEKHPWAPHRGLPTYFKEDWVWENSGRRVTYLELTRDEFKLTARARALSTAWFKNNLAAAIIRGKLLVIPIIDIE